MKTRMVVRKLDALIAVAHRGIDELESERNDLENLRFAEDHAWSANTQNKNSELDSEIAAINQLIASAMEGLTYLREWRLEKSWKKVVQKTEVVRETV